jgi:hypothetical protein
MIDIFGMDITYTSTIFHQNDLPDDGGCKHLWNTGQFLPKYTA